MENGSSQRSERFSLAAICYRTQRWKSSWPTGVSSDHLLFWKILKGSSKCIFLRDIIENIFKTPEFQKTIINLLKKQKMLLTLS